MIRNVRTLKAQTKQTMLSLGHKPSNFTKNYDETFSVYCHRCNATAKIEEGPHNRDLVSGDAINAEKSCNGATPIRIQQARENEQIWSKMRRVTK